MEKCSELISVSIGKVSIPFWLLIQTYMYFSGHRKMHYTESRFNVESGNIVLSIGCSFIAKIALSLIPEEPQKLSKVAQFILTCIYFGLLPQTLKFENRYLTGKSVDEKVICV